MEAVACREGERLGGRGSRDLGSLDKMVFTWRMTIFSLVMSGVNFLRR